MFKFIYKLLGWKVTHYLPNDIKKCVIIVAPHTSNWDFIYGIGTVQIPIDRNKKNTDGEKTSTVDAMADLFSKHDELRLVITPEGTRSRVEKWRTGFYYVALKANVPIALAFIDYGTKSCGIDKVIYPTGDFKKDMKEIMDFYKTKKAKNPENFSLDLDLS